MSKNISCIFYTIAGGDKRVNTLLNNISPKAEVIMR